jgi:CheY-like chemotaxis protein
MPAETRERILIVEDDAIIRLDLANILKEEGYEVAVAQHGAAALEVLARQPAFGLILIDLMMPVMDGWALRSALLADDRFKRIPVIILSAVSQQRSERADIQADGFLEKPFNLEGLLDVVSKHLPARSG